MLWTWNSRIHGPSPIHSASISLKSKLCSLPNLVFDKTRHKRQSLRVWHGTTNARHDSVGVSLSTLVNTENCSTRPRTSRIVDQPSFASANWRMSRKVFTLRTSPLRAINFFSGPSALTLIYTRLHRLVIYHDLIVCTGLELIDGRRSTFFRVQIALQPVGLPSLGGTEYVYIQVA